MYFLKLGTGWWVDHFLMKKTDIILVFMELTFSPVDESGPKRIIQPPVPCKWVILYSVWAWIVILYLDIFIEITGLPRGSVVKNSPANAGDTRSIPESERLPGRRNGNPLQYSCLWNPINRGTWWATVCGVAKSQTRLSNWTTATYPKRRIQ